MKVRPNGTHSPGVHNPDVETKTFVCKVYCIHVLSSILYPLCYMITCYILKNIPCLCIDKDNKASINQSKHIDRPIPPWTCASTEGGTCIYDRFPCSASVYLVSLSHRWFWQIIILLYRNGRVKPGGWGRESPFNTTGRLNRNAQLPGKHPINKFIYSLYIPHPCISLVRWKCHKNTLTRKTLSHRFLRLCDFPQIQSQFI